MTTAEILESARTMRADEQLFLIDSLFAMLDVPDPAIEVAYDIGKLPRADFENLMAKYR